MESPEPRGGSAALAERALDPFELFVGSLPDRPLEPLAGRKHVPASEEQECRAHRQDRVVEEVPVEALVPRDPGVGERKHEDHRDERDPERAIYVTRHKSCQDFAFSGRMEAC
jgi:hypothetical protein